MGSSGSPDACAGVGCVWWAPALWRKDLLVKRRMKGRGMRWTRRGADHLLALRARRFCDRWPTEWGVIAG
jgi:hypothetical protein